MTTDSLDIANEIRRLPFHNRYERAGLPFERSCGWLIPSEFQPIAMELSLLNSGHGVLDFSDRGVLELTGKDTIDFLHRISTNDFHSSNSTNAVQTLLLNEKGRVLDSVLVLRLDEKALVITSRGGEQEVKEWLDRFIIMDDVSIRDRTGESVILARLIGRNASEADRAHLLGPSTITAYFNLNAEILLASKDESVLTRIEEGGCTQVGDNAYEVFRLDNGMPSYRKEMAGEFNPLEINLRSQISFDKGCYIGQEIVARLDTYQKVQRQLCLVSWKDKLPLIDTLLLRPDGREAGVISSQSPRISGDNIQKGLAVIRKEHAVTGNQLLAKANGTAVSVDHVFES